MQKIYKRAFTMVELIIVIIILAILATIAYLTLRDYPGNARDGVRKADIKNLEKVIEIYSFQKGELPDPDEPKTEEGDWTIGKFGEGVYAQINDIKPLPVDPSTKKYYTYALNKTTGKFKLTANLENGQQFTTGNAGGSSTSSSTTGGSNTPTPTSVNGVCGSSHNQSFETQPTSNLCTKGTASAVSGTGPWSWICAGQNGGTDANCSANKTVTPLRACESQGGLSFTFQTGTKGPTGVVKDNNTGLMWESEGSNGSTDSSNHTANSQTMPWTEAKSRCANFTKGGFTDWRLPDITELRSIVNYNCSNLAVNTAYFYLANGYYWSSTNSASSTYNAWILDFYHGNGGSTTKSNSYYVLCVR